MIEDAELDAAAPGRARRRAARRPRPPRADERGARARSRGPDAAERIADEILATAGRRDERRLEGRELHFIAIGGAGHERPRAGLPTALGADGDAAPTAPSRAYLERLRRAGLEPRVGHDADAVPAGAEVVVSTAIAEDNPELARARERGQRVIHRGELLAELCALRRLIAVAGTHGKTTTAGMLRPRRCGRSAPTPRFFLGGELPGAGRGGEAANAGWGEGEWVVAEADESDGSFLELRPEVAVVTNVELDHHSRWGSLARAAPGASAAFADAGAWGAARWAPERRPRRASRRRSQRRWSRFDAERAAARPERSSARAFPAGTTSLNARARARRALALAGADAEALRRGAGRLPGRRAPPRAARAPAQRRARSTTTTPTTRPRSRRASRRCASSSRVG